MIRLGLIGWPLGHSFSPQYFSEKFAEEVVEGSYELFPLENFADFEALLREYGDLAGLNVTIPYKQAVMERLDCIDQAAHRIGAVNTIQIRRSGDERNSSGKPVLKGYNTDWTGFRDSLLPMLPERREGMSALVLGTGGAARAVAYALAELQIPCTFVSRRPMESKLQPAVGYESLNAEIVGSNKLIVNTTPLGMSPGTRSAPGIPYEYVTAGHICYDLIYNPGQTEFLRRCAARGAQTKNGLEMLHRQADAAWHIFTEGLL